MIVQTINWETFGVDFAVLCNQITMHITFVNYRNTNTFDCFMPVSHKILSSTFLFRAKKYAMFFFVKTKLI